MQEESIRGTETNPFPCCIAGGGPAGMMLGFLLARAGVEVLVLEKHGDFLRDFRGDTIHPSTLELMHELGLLEAFLARPHQQAPQLQGQVGEETVVVADFSHLPTHCRYYRFHAAMGLSEFPERTRSPLSHFPPTNADGGHRTT